MAQGFGKTARFPKVDLSRAEANNRRRLYRINLKVVEDAAVISVGGAFAEAGGAVLLRIINAGRNARRSMAPGSPRILANRMFRLSRAITSKPEVAVVRGG